MSFVDIKEAAPILLAVYDPDVMAALAEGDEIVSEDYQISVLGEPHGDVEILHGLFPGQGFVLNPGEWSLFFWLGKASVKVKCS